MAIASSPYNAVGFVVRRGHSGQHSDRIRCVMKGDN